MRVSLYYRMRCGEMTYIYQRKEWPHFFWDIKKIEPSLSRVRFQQGYLLGRMSSLGFELQAEAGLQNLSLDVLKSSSIEGEILNPEQVRSSLGRRLGIDVGGLSANTRDVDGVVEMVLDATQRIEQPLTRERLFHWHALLFSGRFPGITRIGAFRTLEMDPMQVVSGYYGHERVHYEAPAADMLEKEVSAFLDWFNTDDGTDPVIRAAIAHLWFVSIHPFADGNGRIARAVADCSLSIAEKNVVRFYSISSQIEKERNTYYDVLESTQKGNLDITNWVEWFIGCFERALDGADQVIQAVLKKSKIWNIALKYTINERQRKIINKLLDGFEGKLTSSKYAKINGCSQDTALRDIKLLIEYGILEEKGESRRGASYALIETD